MRGKRFPKRTILPDPKYKSIFVARFVNLIMMGGKKSTATYIVYKALDIIEEKTKRKPLDVLEESIRNVSPPLEVRPRRIGGANYQIPMEVSRDRQITLAARWIIEAARNRSGKPMSQALASEILDASKKEGSAMKKRENMLRMAEANRAFAHFARM